MEQQSTFTRCVFAHECVRACIYFVAVQAVFMSLFVYLFMHQSLSTPSLLSLPLLPSHLLSLPFPLLPSPPLPSPLLLQSAVKAALEGRLLVLEGIEKAERNVLPVLNNLLENREMQLEDGHFLVAPKRYDKLAKVLYTQRAFSLVSPCMSKCSNSAHVRISRDCPTYLYCMQ